MDEVSTVLKKLSTSQHYLASKLINHIISHGWHYEHQDPGKPSWRAEPSDVVLNGNKDLLENLKNILEKLKSHHHNTERNLIKKYLRRANLPQLWDQLDKLLMVETSRMTEKNSTFGSDSGSSFESGRDSDESCAKEDRKLDTNAASKEIKIQAAIKQEKMDKEDKIFVSKDTMNANQVLQSAHVTNPDKLKETLDKEKYANKDKECKEKDCGYNFSSEEDKMEEDGKVEKINHSLFAGKSDVKKKEAEMQMTQCR